MYVVLGLVVWFFFSLQAKPLQIGEYHCAENECEKDLVLMIIWLQNVLQKILF